MGRVDYNEKMVAAFRKSVETDIVPAVAELKERIHNRLNLDKIMYYDDAISVTGEMPQPVIGTEEIFKNALAMYNDMKPEIGDFMQRMLDAEAFDVEARDGKFGGGYCTTFPKYKQSFTFNVSLSSGSVEITVKVVNTNGNVLVNTDGNEVSDSQKVSVNSSFWQKIVSFFKNLFGINRTVV